MADLLIRNIDPDLKRRVAERAREHKRNLSDEAKSLIRQGLVTPDSETKFGTWMSGLVQPEDRGDDLVFQYRGPPSLPPDFD